MSVVIWTQRVARDQDFTEASWVDISEVMKVRFRAPERFGTAAWKPPRVRVESKHPPADTFDVGPARIVSSKLAAVITDGVPASDYELVPVELSHKGSAVAGYSILHVLRRIDALDHAKSTFTRDDDMIDTIERVVIDPAKVACPLFELDAYAWVLCVNEALAARIRSAGCTGVSFERPDTWRPF